MPDTVPVLDANGNRTTMDTQAYIQAELQKELEMRDSLAAKMGDKDSGIIGEYIKRAKDMQKGAAVSRKLKIEEEFDYSQLNAAKDAGIITSKDAAIFERTINNEIYRGANPQTKDGEFIVDTGRCLIFTDGDFYRPTVSKIIVFTTEYETITADAKKVIRDAAVAGNLQTAFSFVEKILGHGNFSYYDGRTGYSHGGKNGRGKGKNSSGNTFAHRTKSIKERIAEQRDQDYMDALSRSDMDKAEDIIVRAAEDAGYPIKAYHGTPVVGISSFDPKKIGTTTDDGIFGRGFYFSTRRGTAEGYAGENGTVMPVFLAANSPWWANEHSSIADVAEMLGMDESALTIRKSGISKVVAPIASQSAQFSAHLADLGYDSVVVQHGAYDYEIVVFDNVQIKSAEAITRDKNGDIIPPSKRFDRSKSNIDYKLAPETEASSREILANILMENVKPDERVNLERYRDRAAKLDSLEAELDEKTAQLRQLPDTKANTDARFKMHIKNPHLS